MNESQERKLNDVIAQTDSFQTQALRRFGELNESISHATAGVKATAEALKSLEARVKELESARQVQIQINKKIHTHNTAQDDAPKFSILDFFKRK